MAQAAQSAETRKERTFTHMNNNLGVYIHIPFCEHKCDYCNYIVCEDKDDLMPAYQSAVIKHMGMYSKYLHGYDIDTVHFSGGTPSYYGVIRLIELLGELKKSAQLAADAEVTVEVNPGDLSLDDLKALRRAGFNRLSIGAVSTDDYILKSIGRTHSYANVEETVKLARQAGFDNLSIALLYGLPSQDMDTWSTSINKVLALEPEHITCSAFKLEEGTPLYKSKDTLICPDDAACRAMYLYAVKRNEQCGYKQYALSDFAKRGYEARHTLKYLLSDEYIVFGGAGGSSYINQIRFSYYESVVEYIDRVCAGKEIIEQFEKISCWESAVEYLLLRLRTVCGISERYGELFGVNTGHMYKKFCEFESNGWMLKVNGRWRFTPSGFSYFFFLLQELIVADTIDNPEEHKALNELLNRRDTGDNSSCCENSESDVIDAIFSRDRCCTPDEINYSLISEMQSAEENDMQNDCRIMQ